MENQLQECEKFKEDGNTHLKNNEFEQAIDSYTKAIEHSGREAVPNNKIAIYHANRAFAQIKLENYGLAIEDAQKSIKLNPNYEKAYLRLAFSR